MPKRISKKTKDVNQIAAQVVALSTSDPATDRALLSKVMAEMGRKGGRIGGKRRMKTMTAEERKIAASKAARARWGPPKN
jgi:hypothetical protein